MSQQQGQQPNQDPAGNTEAFRAFVTREGSEAEQEKRSPAMLVTGIVIVIVIGVVVWLALAG